MTARTDTSNPLFTQVSERPQIRDDLRLLPRPTPLGKSPGTSPPRVRAWLRAHRPSLLILGPLLLLGALVQGIGMNDAPQRIDDEGTYTAQAWAVFHLHQLTHYTYWYDHPPLGWLQLAGYAQLTGAFDRAPYAVAAGREFMLVVQLVSMVLLWTLARRLDLPRWGAGVAVALFALSPLAVQFHRTVYLDNIATPWVLAALVLALTPKRRLGAFAGAGLCFAVAVLTKETSLLLLPVLAWVLWRNSAGTTRRYALVVSTAVFVLAGVFFVLFAALKGEVVPGVNRTSLFGGLAYQLADRAASGSVFRTGSLGNVTVRQWLTLDLVLPLLSLPAALLGLAVRRLRPFAVGYLLLLALILRPGYLPVPYVIGMLPFAALLVAGIAVAGAAASAGAIGTARVAYRRPLTVFTVLIGVAATVIATPLWLGQQRGFSRSQADRPMVQATDWIRANLPKNERILTDDALWVDLVDSGFRRQDVVWFYKPDTDPAVPTGWSNYDWVISTQSVRTFPTTSATVTGALQHSSPVATFGSGDGLVQIRRVVTGRPDQVDQDRAATAKLLAARALATNSRLDFAPLAATRLQAGQVDSRVLTVLAATTATHTLAVSDLPVISGEDPARRRSVVINRVDGEPITDGPTVTDLTRQLTNQAEDYRPQVRLSNTGGTTQLVLTFPISAG
jgi:4-amino-4-deoxy-L-arabinose transferase-like glycosyltransferase